MVLPIVARLRNPAFADRIHTVDLHKEAADLITELVEALEPVKQAIQQSAWHSIGGEQMKRLLVAQTAIDRINAALAKAHDRQQTPEN